MMFEFDLHNHRPLRELVYEELKKKILKGIIKPGTRIMEVDLAEKLGVSRTPVREAMRKLEKEGLVIIEPRRGAYVSDISLPEMVDVLIVREDLEGLAAYLATSRISEDDLNVLENIIEGYRKAIEEEDIDTIIRLDEKFHKKIVSCTRNNTLIKLSSIVQESALRFRYLYYNDVSRYRPMAVEHQKIVNAIRSGDAAMAREVADKHVKVLKTLIIEEGKETFEKKQEKVAEEAEKINGEMER